MRSQFIRVTYPGVVNFDDTVDLAQLLVHDPQTLSHMPRVPIDIPFAEAGLKYLPKSTHVVSSTR
jgi:hypothetical protein